MAARRRGVAAGAGIVLAACLVPFVAAAPAAPGAPETAPLAAPLPFGYLLSPPAGRPGEVVRIELLTNLRQATGRILTTRIPTVHFWWKQQPAVQTVGRIDEAGNILAELVVPFSAQRGLDPIVVAVDVPPTPTPTPVDTAPPEIRGPSYDVKVLCYPPGSPNTVNISAFVTDDVAVGDVELFYRRPGDTNYQSVPMAATGGGNYTTSITVTNDPAWFAFSESFVATGLTFFVRATDLAGLSSQSPVGGPIIVTTCATPTPVSSGPIIFLPVPPGIFILPTPTPTPPILYQAPNAVGGAVPGGARLLLANEGGAGTGGTLPGGARPAQPAPTALPVRILGELPFVVTRSAGPPVWEH